MNRQMTDEEMLKKYNQADKEGEKKAMIQTIADLNGAEYEEIDEILMNLGAATPKPRKRKTKSDSPVLIRKIISKAMQEYTDEIDKLNIDRNKIIKEKLEPLEKDMKELENQIITCREFLKGMK